jgi:hypothetical protein
MQLSLDFGGEKLNDSWPHGRRDFDIWGEWRRNVGEEMTGGGLSVREKKRENAMSSYT